LETDSNDLIKGIFYGGCFFVFELVDYFFNYFITIVHAIKNWINVLITVFAVNFCVSEIHWHTAFWTWKGCMNLYFTIAIIAEKRIGVGVFEAINAFIRKYDL